MQGVPVEASSIKTPLTWRTVVQVRGHDRHSYFKFLVVRMCGMFLLSFRALHFARLFFRDVACIWG